jgi:hypothetical protein
MPTEAQLLVSQHHDLTTSDETPIPDHPEYLENYLKVPRSLQQDLGRAPLGKQWLKMTSILHAQVAKSETTQATAVPTRPLMHLLTCIPMMA